MFDLNTINKRYFEIKMGKQILEIEPPTKKMLNKITSLRGITDENEATSALYEAASMILNKNKTNRKFSDEVVEELNLDQINGIISEYFLWLSVAKKSKN
ncbi:hypothetical protein [Clostridium estertheticum]|uniref:Phage tail assembly protein n=1 Tax=Clostridium estertheticum TaxID=238834 RepID=A0AA47I7G1_9CLOT|nr:hypothetical protein [Clostridium estertheticum]MBU3153504.1 hypothetical protein [Clostridium estertheticum]WAG60905.1 hypothetical protein LL038_01240 [Clostridium estertheticum]